jgi:phosphoglycerate kinase
MSSFLKNIKTIESIEVTGKVTFVRLDLNVPIKNGIISDDTRIRESLPTIRYLLDKKAKIILASHLGRPKSAHDKAFSLEPVGQKLAEMLGIEVILAEDHSIDFMKPTLTGLTKNQIILLENLRFQEGETNNDEALAREWASYCDIYINDAFGASHRAHASIDALPKLMRVKACGFLIKKELEMLGQLLDHPKKPFLAILGGAKVSDKIKMIENLIDKVDAVIIGGAMAYTFIKAQGGNVGKSLVEVDQIHYAKELIKRFEARNKSILLPVDHVFAVSINDTEEKGISDNQNIPHDMLGVDIGPKSISAFVTAINEANTIFWNGPMGVFETEAFSKGTCAIAKALANKTGALRIIGGGDSASAANKAGVANQIDHISTGGGASLEFIQGDKLPGIEALRERHRS